MIGRVVGPFMALLALGVASCGESGPPPETYDMAPSGAQIVSSEGQCVDVQRSGSESGTPVIVFHCHGTPNQTWTLRRGQIIGIGGSCLDVQGSAPVDGAPLIVVACSGAPSQQWSLSDGKIVGIGGKCIDTADGGTFDRTPIVLAPCRSRVRSQVWSVT
jgi:hypothetical protein